MWKPVPRESCPCCGGPADEGIPTAWPDDQPELDAGYRCAGRLDVLLPQTRRHRYTADLQRILRRFYRAGGIELSSDRHGHLAGIRRAPEGLRPATTRNHLFCTGPCDCACQDDQYFPGHQLSGSLERRTVSDRVTWELCPHCGGLAAVGWAAVTTAGGGPARHALVEYDCPAGCRPTSAELKHLTARDDVAMADDDGSTSAGQTEP